MIAKSYSIYERKNIPVQEAYRALRTNIQFCGIDKRVKSLTITSCSPGEGKTTTSVNLAISMAKSGLKVLLVDADMRKPAVVKHLGANNSTGLSNLISGRAGLNDVLNATSIENLYFIACGPKPPNSAELIGSRRFTEFMEQACREYDMVIFDTPPLGSVIDSAILASMTEGTLLVIRSKKISYMNAFRVKTQLEKANARLLGVVLNQVDKKEYKNYCGYYDYYGSSRKFIHRKKSLFERIGLLFRSRKVEV